MEEIRKWQDNCSEKEVSIRRSDGGIKGRRTVHTEQMLASLAFVFYVSVVEHILSGFMKNVFNLKAIFLRWL
jgi:hypothetical protein